MCQLFQNSSIDLLFNGDLKFCGNVNPSINASPIAISVYPLKSKYIWKRKNIEKNHAEKKSNWLKFSYIGSTIKYPILSAIIIFLNIPIKKIKKPNSKKYLIFLFSKISIWFLSSSNFRIGPAISWGKKDTKKNIF